MNLILWIRTKTAWLGQGGFLCTNFYCIWNIINTFECVNFVDQDGVLVGWGDFSMSCKEEKEEVSMSWGEFYKKSRWSRWWNNISESIIWADKEIITWIENLDEMSQRIQQQMMISLPSQVDSSSSRHFQDLTSIYLRILEN